MASRQHDSRPVGYVPLQEHLEKLMEAKFRAQSDALALAFNAQNEAVKLAREDLAHWKAEHNEFQKRMEHERSNFVRADKLSDAVTPMELRVRKLESAADNAAGRATMTAVLAASVTAVVVGAVTALVVTVITKAWPG